MQRRWRYLQCEPGCLLYAHGLKGVPWSLKKRRGRRRKAHYALAEESGAVEPSPGAKPTASPPPPGLPVDFDQYNELHLPAVILKTFLRELPEPLLTFDLYPHVVGFLSECSCPLLQPGLGGGTRDRYVWPLVLPPHPLREKSGWCPPGTRVRASVPGTPVTQALVHCRH